MFRAHIGARRLIIIVSRTLFALGLAVQLSSPCLPIKDGEFVITQAMASGQTVSPVALVARERKTQMISVVLAVSGALGLVVSYGRSFFLYWILLGSFSRSTDD